jgi:hypothetical protein
MAIAHSPIHVDTQFTHQDTTPDLIPHQSEIVVEGDFCAIDRDIRARISQKGEIHGAFNAMDELFEPLQASPLYDHPQEFKLLTVFYLC